MTITRAGVALAALVLCVGPAVAEAPQPFPVFEAKRIKVPGASVAKGVEPVRRRITVQIDPEEQAAILAARPPMEKAGPLESEPDSADTRPKSGKYDWFWNEVSPDIGVGPGRLAQAMRAIQGAQNVSAPRMQAMQDIARAQGAPILKATVGTRVSPALVLAVIAVESSGRSDAVSSAGAAGLMQLQGPQTPFVIAHNRGFYVRRAPGGNEVFDACERAPLSTGVTLVAPVGYNGNPYRYVHRKFAQHYDCYSDISVPGFIRSVHGDNKSNPTQMGLVRKMKPKQVAAEIAQHFHLTLDDLKAL